VCRLADGVRNLPAVGNQCQKAHGSLSLVVASEDFELQKADLDIDAIRQQIHGRL